MHTNGASFLGWFNRVWSTGLPGRVFLLAGVVALLGMARAGLRAWRLRGAGGPGAMLDQLRRLVQAGNLARAEALLAQGGADREPARVIAALGFGAALEAVRAARAPKDSAQQEVDAAAPASLGPGETARVRMTAAIPQEYARATSGLSTAQWIAGASCAAGVWTAVQTGGTTRLVAALVALGVFFVVMVTTHIADLHRRDLSEVVNAVGELCDQPQFGAEDEA